MTLVQDVNYNATSVLAACVDRNECFRDSPCDSQADCINTAGRHFSLLLWPNAHVGSFTCQCHVGLDGDGYSSAFADKTGCSGELKFPFCSRYTQIFVQRLAKVARVNLEVHVLSLKSDTRVLVLNILKELTAISINVFVIPLRV